MSTLSLRADGKRLLSRPSTPRRPPVSRARGIYLHIPFCLRRCSYCDFASYPCVRISDRLREAYLAALRKEVQLYRMSLRPARYDTLFIGGGTPTTLPPGELARLVEELAESFNLPAGAEITVEANPDTIGREYLATLRKAGVSRLSMGVQSTNDRELAFLHRTYRRRGLMEKLALVAKAGFASFNFDLIYGIPGQTPASWRKTLREVLSFHPPHLSAYQLTPEGRTPLVRWLERGWVEMPGDRQVAELTEILTAKTESFGLYRYEVSNFARPGHECRHNLKYWFGVEYLALGLGAHGYLEGIRYRNTTNLKDYVESLSRNRLPVAWLEQADSERRRFEELAVGLRTCWGVGLSPAELGRLSAYLGKHPELIRYLALAEGKLSMTSQGLEHLDYLASLITFELSQAEAEGRNEVRKALSAVE